MTNGRNIGAALDVAIRICAEHGTTPDALAAALLVRGEGLGRGRTWARGPARSEAFRRYITSGRFPCALTGAETGLQAAHLNWAWHFRRPDYGRSIKVDDLRCVPLSPEAHQRLDGGHVTDVALRLQLALALVDCLVAWIKDAP